MSITATYGGYVSDGYQTVSDSATVDSDFISKYSIALNANSTNVQIPVAFLTAKLRHCYLLASAATTLKFNSSGSPAPQIDLAAGIPRKWTATSGETTPFSVDVTTLYATCTPASNLTLWFGVNK